LKPSTSLRAFRRRLFACSLLTVLLYLLQPGVLLMADEQDDLAKLLSLNKQFIELYQAGKFEEAIPIAQELLEFSEKAFGPDHLGTATFLNNLIRLAMLITSDVISIAVRSSLEPYILNATTIYERYVGDENDLRACLAFLYCEIPHFCFPKNHPHAGEHKTRADE
jgi:hypothetical protein